jgi:hypothetical protein
MQGDDGMVKELIVVGDVVESATDIKRGSAVMASLEAGTDDEPVITAPSKGDLGAEAGNLPNDSLQPNQQIATTQAPEVRASVLSTGSELSAQWYRSPRERLGLFLTVTKRGSAPWERKGEKLPPRENPVISSPVRVGHGKRTWKTLWLSSSRK